MKKATALTLIITLLFSFSFVTTAKNGKPAIGADGYILLEKDDGHVVASENAEKRLPPASTTKIMTALVVLENASLSECVTVSENAAGTEGSSAYLRRGESLTVGELLYALLLQSANDAATALAEHVAGSAGSFAGLMNRKASQLGLARTHFTNPHGLDDKDHYTSAYDLAVLTAAALEDPRFSSIVSTKQISIGKDESARTFVNHNRLLFTLDGCIGVKTGYTIRSGRCLVSACRRKETTLICVTLNCRDDWNAHKALYAYGFERVTRTVIPVQTRAIPLIGSADKTVTLSSQPYSLLTNAASRVTTKTVCPRFLFPPLRAGERIGELIVYVDGKESARLPLVCREDCPTPEKAGFFARIFNRIYELFHKE